MSSIAERSEIMRAFAGQDRDPGFRAWLREHSSAVDEDGFQVICSFAASESAAGMIREVQLYPHPVIVTSLVDDKLVSFEVGSPITDTPEREDFDITDETTVADVARVFVAATSKFIVLAPADEASLVLSR
ncbi:MAG: hypothetical protein ACRDRL_12200 [Sciscionella sp.]